jgi:predicted transcriptional regulator
LKTKWPDDQPFIKKKLIMVPSSGTKGTQLDQKCRELFQKKSWYLLSILILTSDPISMAALMEVFEYKNEKSFRENYIKPLRSAKLIQQTIPDNPTDPANKYVLTEKGKHFLGGTLL